MGYSAKPPGRIIAVLKLPRYQVPLLISRALSIVERVADNPWFPAPRPTLKEVRDAIDDLEQAQTAALTRAKGAATVRDTKREALVSKLEQLRSYVQAIAETNYEQAASIIESAGMYVKQVKGPEGRTFVAKNGRVSGEVVVQAPKAGDRAGYEFQYSLDGGTTWLAFREQFMTKTTVTLTGQTPGAMVHFRYRATVKGVTGDWSDPIVIMVV